MEFNKFQGKQRSSTRETLKYEQKKKDLSRARGQVLSKLVYNWIENFLVKF